MKKTKFNYIIMLAILIAGFASAPALAQVQKQCEQHGKEGMQGQLGKGAGEEMSKGNKDMAFIRDLTPEQQKQISALKLNLIKDRMSIQNLIDEKKAHLKTISTGDNVDLMAVNKTIDELFALKAELTKKHIAFQQDVRKLLTADQKVIFDIHSDKEKGHSEGMRPGSEMKGMGNGGCKMDGNGHGMGMGNRDMKGCGQMGSGSDCCKDKAGDTGCKGKGDDGQGEGKMQGSEGHGQGAGNGTGCCKKM
jgi:Spy/CpxP family protein refolding chaperone